jgi:hypothetical protein
VRTISKRGEERGKKNAGSPPSASSALCMSGRLASVETSCRASGMGYSVHGVSRHDATPCFLDSVTVMLLYLKKSAQEPPPCLTSNSSFLHSFHPRSERRSWVAEAVYARSVIGKRTSFLPLRRVLKESFNVDSPVPIDYISIEEFKNILWLRHENATKTCAGGGGVSARTDRQQWHSLPLREPCAGSTSARRRFRHRSHVCCRNYVAAVLRLEEYGSGHCMAIQNRRGRSYGRARRVPRRDQRRDDPLTRDDG